MRSDEGVASDNHYRDRGCDWSRCLNESSALACVKEQEQRPRGCVKHRKHELRGGKLPRIWAKGKFRNMFALSQECFSSPVILIYQVIFIWV